MIYLLLVLLFVVIGFVCCRSFYLSSISCVKICQHVSDHIDSFVIPVKPSKQFFKSIAAGLPSSFVPLGNGFLAFYVSDPDSIGLFYDGLLFSPSVYIFKVSRFGRFKSVDLSDRCLNETIKRFKGV